MVGSSKAKFSSPLVISVPAAEGPPIAVKLGPRPAAYPQILATDSCGKEGWPIEQGRRALINRQRAVPMVVRVQKQINFFRNHNINCEWMLKIMDILSSHAKTDDGQGGTKVSLSALSQFFQIEAPTITIDRTVLAVSRVRAPAASATPTVAKQFSKFSAFGSRPWEASIENLNITQNILNDLQRSYHRTRIEHNFRLLIVLQTVLKARRQFNKEQFLSHFSDDEEAMEDTLQIAVVQGLTARTHITQRRTGSLDDFDEGADGTSLGPNSNRAHRLAKGLPLGEADDEAAALKATGILAKVARGNLTLHNLYAIKSTEKFIAAEKFDSEVEGREEGALGEGDGDDSDYIGLLFISPLDLDITNMLE
ncbi:hypothetical protein B0H16DRAFT_1476219 [Mycena metata]|uniref:Uncharacterized protein n=1 Tax=Mycena metata TaxID=1033252 RepID=A0AAD7HBT8_9AGAR|nr:hypothetical protein B0H16DRAFT_1476219 [Mycena metata]